MTKKQRNKVRRKKLKTKIYWVNRKARSKLFQAFTKGE